MFKRLSGRFTGVVCLLAVLAVCELAVSAQVEKGSKEITVFSGGFFADLNKAETIDRTVIFGNTIESRSSSRSQGFDLGGKFGYFLTRHHEVGGGLNLTFIHSRFCLKTVQNGAVLRDSCEGDSFTALGLNGFYRYNFAGKGARGFPFVGVGIDALNLTNDFGRLARLRPEGGYKYFLNKNVALDISVGVSVDLNKNRDFGDDEDEGGVIPVNNFSFETKRRVNLNGRIGLSFVF